MVPLIILRVENHHVVVVRPRAAIYDTVAAHYKENWS